MNIHAAVSLPSGALSMPSILPNSGQERNDSGKVSSFYAHLEHRIQTDSSLQMKTASQIMSTDENLASEMTASIDAHHAVDDRIPLPSVQSSSLGGLNVAHENGKPVLTSSNSFSIEETGNNSDDEMHNYVQDNPDVDLMETFSSLNSKTRMQKSKNQEDMPLYPEAEISLYESASMLLAFFLRHHLTKDALHDLLTLVKLHCPKSNVCIDSVYKFLYIFYDLRGESVRHYYCSQCFSLMSKSSETCDRCLCNASKTMKPYFVELPVESEMRNLMARPGFYNSLKRSMSEQSNDGIYSDVQSGKVFGSNPFLKEFKETSLSFTWNTDGIPLFHSSNTSMWPIYLAINELSIVERYKKENVLYVGLWIGGKPDMNIFLKVLEKFLNAMKCGMKFYTPDAPTLVELKGVLLCGTCDLAAKASVLNMTQFNGNYGCSVCKHPGTTHAISEKSRVHVYLNLPEVAELRTHAEIMHNAEQSICLGKPVFGVIGPTRLALFVHDIVNSTGVDVMHGVFIGVMGKLMRLWFTSPYSRCDFSVYKLLDVVDKWYLQIKPPNFVQRTPRSIRNTLPHWKATEYKNFALLYSVPLLADIMDSRCIHHHILLITAISLLCQEVVTESEVVLADNLLIEYVLMFESLYTPRHLTINVHNLLHLAACVRNLGPLWIVSCFPFEHLNGMLLKRVHGTQHAELQTDEAISLITSAQVIFNEIDPNSMASLYISSLQSSKKMPKFLERISPNICAIGTYSNQAIPQNLKDLVSNEISGSCQYNFLAFYRLQKRNILYCSKGYYAPKKRNSYTVEYDNCQIKKYGYVVQFLKCVCQNDEHVQCKTLFLAIIEKINVDNSTQFVSGTPFHSSLPNIKMIINMPCDYEIIDVNSLLRLCVCVSFDDKKYIVMPPNDIEFEK